MECSSKCFQYRGIGKNTSQEQRTPQLDQGLDQVPERSRIGMREIGWLIERVNSEAFQSVEAVAPNHQRAHRAGLVSANHDQLQFPVPAEYGGAGLHPGKLMHGAVRGIGKQIPSPGFILDGTEFLHNPD